MNQEQDCSISGIITVQFIQTNFYVYNGILWEKVTEKDIQRKIVDLKDDLELYTKSKRSNKEKLERYITKLESNNIKKKIIEELKGLNVKNNVFDKNLHFLNLKNGLLDLRGIEDNGEIIGFEFYDHSEYSNEDDFMNNSLDFDYINIYDKSKLSLWIQTLEEMFPVGKFKNEQERNYVLHFLQKLMGCCMYPSVKEQKVFFFYGEASNGKSTLLDAIQDILKLNYRVGYIDSNKTKASSNVDLIAREFSNTINRTVTVIKELHTSRLDGIILKKLTEKTLDFREIYKKTEAKENYSTFIVTGNTKPKFNALDKGQKRRIVIVPFLKYFSEEERDFDLPDKLKVIYPYIFKWMLDGLRMYLNEGLDLPDVIKRYTDDTILENDSIQRFINNMLVKSPKHKIGKKDMFEHYQDWLKENNENFNISSVKFYEEMESNIDFQYKTDENDNLFLNNQSYHQSIPQAILLTWFYNYNLVNTLKVYPHHHLPSN